MRRHAIIFCLAAALVGSTGTRVARAEDDVAILEAKARFEEGLGLADVGQHEAARLKFQQAWAVFKAPAVLYNLARSEQLTGRDVEALDHFRLFLRIGATDVKITEVMRDRARENVKNLASKIGQIEIEAPPTAQIIVDGKPLEDGPRELVPVRPGRHTVEAKFEGQLKTMTVECGTGRIAKAKLSFEPSDKSAGAKAADWSPARIATVSALSLGAVAGGVFVFVFRANALSVTRQSRDLRPNGESCIGVNADPCPQVASLKQDHDAYMTSSLIAGVAGGILAAGAVTAALVWPARDGSTAKVAPLVGPGFGGATLGGRF